MPLDGGQIAGEGDIRATPVTDEATATAGLRALLKTVAAMRMGPHTTRRPGVSSAVGFPFVEAGAREGSQPEWAKTPLFAVAWSRGPNVRYDARLLEPRDRARPSVGLTRGWTRPDRDRWNRLERRFDDVQERNDSIESLVSVSATVYPDQ